MASFVMPIRSNLREVACQAVGMVMLFGRAVEPQPLDAGRQAIAQPLQQRQDASSSSSASSLASPVSVPASADALTSATSPLSAGATPSITSSASDAANKGYVTITEFEPKPTFTATQTVAYVAPGVNGTEIKPATTTLTASEYLVTANATAPGIPSNELTACQINGTGHDNGPFCSPIHAQELWAGYTYGGRLGVSTTSADANAIQVTWNPALFSANGTESVVLRYQGGSEDVVWTSPEVKNGKGYVNMNMDKAWLLGAPGNDSTSGQNITLSLVSSGGKNVTNGPMISLVVNPKTLTPVLIPKIASKYGLEIGLPVGLVGALIIILAIWCGMRKHDRSWRDAGIHGKDYMARRRRRGGGGRRGGGKGGEIQLNDWESERGHDVDQFTDEPYRGGSGNAFQDEIKRQRQEDDTLKRTVTSF